MRQDPIISGGWIKAALVLLVGGALGVGAYLLASGVDIELPEIESIDSGDSATSFSDTSLEDTTIGDAAPTVAAGPLTTAGFAAALAKVREAVGSGEQATRVSINETQTQFSVRRGDGIEVYAIRADSGDLERLDATVSVSGNATLADFAFGLDGIEPAAIDGMLATAQRQSGASDFQATVLNLERRIPFGSKELAWTINAEGGGRNLTYRATAAGTDVQEIGGGTAIPPEVQQAQELNRCIEAAGTDIDEVTACFDRFSR